MRCDSSFKRSPFGSGFKLFWGSIIASVVAICCLGLVVGNSTEEKGGLSSNQPPVITSDSVSNQVLGFIGDCTETASCGVVESNICETPHFICPGTNLVNSGFEVPAVTRMPTNVWFSPTLRELIKLIQADVDEAILKSYIRHAPGPFHLQVEHIIYLRDLGVSAELIDAILEHDSKLGFSGFGSAAHVSSSMTNVAEPSEPAVSTITNVIVITNVVEQPVITHQYFYEVLSPYGTWVFIDHWGWCWRPTIVVIHRDWRPYCHGGWWVYTSFGWYWHSIYKWGEITFHYGRWFHHPVWGWCWWPDYQWAPAWVVWKVHTRHCGWAPLPPGTRFHPGKGLHRGDTPLRHEGDLNLHPHHFTFVQWEDMTQKDLPGRCLPGQGNEHLARDGQTIFRYEVGPDGVIRHRGIETEFTTRFGPPTAHPIVLEKIRGDKTDILKAKVLVRPIQSDRTPVLIKSSHGTPRLDIGGEKDGEKAEQITQGRENVATIFKLTKRSSLASNSALGGSSQDYPSENIKLQHSQTDNLGRKGELPPVSEQLTKNFSPKLEKGSPEAYRDSNPTITPGPKHGPDNPTFYGERENARKPFSPRHDELGIVRNTGGSATWNATKPVNKEAEIGNRNKSTTPSPPKPTVPVKSSEGNLPNTARNVTPSVQTGPATKASGQNDSNLVTKPRQPILVSEKMQNLGSGRKEKEMDFTSIKSSGPSFSSKVVESSNSERLTHGVPVSRSVQQPRGRRSGEGH